MNKGLIAGAVAIGLVATGVMAVPVVERYASIRIKAEIERDGSSTVGGVEVGLLARSIALTDLKSSRQADMSIGRWRASGLGWPMAELMQGRTPLAGLKWGDPLQAERLELNDLRIGKAEEIAALVVYLASDESSYTTGVAHPIDGGWTNT